MRLQKKSMWVALLSAGLFAGVSHAATKTYTLDADFDEGVVNGVNHDAPGSNQLQINTTGTTFPYFWIANAGEHSLSKMNTDGTPPGGNPGDGCEEARYYTYFSTQAPSNGAFSGPAPSRTAVDINGDVYVANRHFSGNLQPNLIKIAVSGGIDRNGNGVIDTGGDTNGDCVIDASEMLPVVDGAAIGGVGIPGQLDITDFHDERVLWVATYGTGGSLGRSLCLDNDGDVWAGTYFGSTYYKFDEDGNVLVGPGGSEIDTAPGTNGVDTGATSYGCAVDAQGRLWGATLGSTMVELNTNTNTHTVNRTGSSNYGIALGNGRVYLGSTLREFNPALNSFGPIVASSGTGVGVDGDGAVWFGTPTLRKFVVDGATGNLNSVPVCSVSTPSDRGPIIDSKGNAWVVSSSTNTTYQYDTNCNFVSSRPVGSRPYTYSDATGLGARTQTDPTGIWTVIYDGGAAGIEWDYLDWNAEAEGSIPNDASITVEARSADTVVGLASLAYTPVSKGSPGSGLMGQFIQARVVMRPDSAGASPVLSDFTIAAVQENVASCDNNQDGEVNILDIQAINASRNMAVPPADPILDINVDGVVNVLDARVCITQCTNSRCAISAPL